MGSVSSASAAASAAQALNPQDALEAESEVDTEIIEKGAPRSYVYYSTMMLLSRLSQLDSLEAKHILTNGKIGARKHLRAVMKADFVTELTKNHRLQTDYAPSTNDHGLSPLALPPLSAENAVRKFSINGLEATPRSDHSTPREPKTPNAHRLDLLRRTSLVHGSARPQSVLSESNHSLIRGEDADEADRDSDAE